MTDKLTPADEKSLPTFLIDNGAAYTVLKPYRSKPCKAFSKYKGIRAPNCGCLPCSLRYADGQKEKGNRVQIL